jgi:putative peptidoglycan lipid II flippase
MPWLFVFTLDFSEKRRPLFGTRSKGAGMKLYRSFATIGGMTMISRVLGYLRDALFAAVLGANWVADAFLIAQRFPNLFLRLFGEGTLNSAVVPIYTRKLDNEGPLAARAFAEEVLAVLISALMILVVLGEIFMPQLMYLMAWGFSGDPGKFDLAVLMARIAFPYLMCMSLVALQAGVLNANGKFAAAAAAPVIFNVVSMIMLLISLSLGLRQTPEAGMMQAWGIAIAGFLHLTFLALMTRRVGMDLNFVRPKLTPDVRELLWLAVPAIAAGGINQINLLIGSLIASLQPSAVSYLYYADRLYQLPLGVVGIAVGVALLPELSRRLAAGDEAGASDSQSRSLEFAMLLTVPAAAALFVIPGPLIAVLYERGAFTAADAHQTSLALAAYAFGLPAFVLNKVFSPGFFARGDTRSPMIFAGVSVAVNVAGSLALYWPFGFVGIAVATTLSGWVNAGQLGVTLYNKGHFQIDARLRRRLPLIFLSSIVMAAALWGAAMALQEWFGHENYMPVRLAALLVLVLGGLAVYGAAIHYSGAASLSELRRELSQRKGRKNTPAIEDMSA